MTAALPAVAADGASRSWRHALLAAVRTEFRAEVYVPSTEDRVLNRRAPTDVQLARGPVDACAVKCCRRSRYLGELCRAHHGRWLRAGRPPVRTFRAAETPARHGIGSCAVPRCRFPSVMGGELCDAHERRRRGLRRQGESVDVEQYVARLLRAPGAVGPRFSTCGLGRVAQLELQYALQTRHDSCEAALTAGVFNAVVAWVARAGVESLLERGDRWWKRCGEQTLRPAGRGHALAFLRYARHQLQLLREADSSVEVWEWDTWPVERIDLDGRWAHQPHRRIYFSDIEPEWLKALAKRWARWRLSAATLSPNSIEHTCCALRRLSRWLDAQDELPARPGELTRDQLERFMAWLSTAGIGRAGVRSIVVHLKVFLDDVRMHDWVPDLPTATAYHRGELPRLPAPLPRYIDEFVMGQIEAEENLAELPDQTTRTVVRLLIETGLRSIDALRLPFDPITTDQAGAPYLVFRNHKLSREAVVPISDRVLADIRRQQDELRERFATAPSCLFPRPWRNADGSRPLGGGTLNRRLERWLDACEIRDAQGGRVRVTSHQFRHTLGTRLVNNEVSLEIVRRLLDHNSAAMTARYARIKDQTLRREWERYQQRLNVRGELITLDPDGPISDAAWAKENLGRAKQTLPNGYCGLPLQQACPHPNACLTCDDFLTTVEFLARHREQLARTEQLIAQAQADGRERLLEMNEPVRVNLIRVIEGLETLQRESPDAA